MLVLLQHFFCSLFSFLIRFVFWGYWTTKAQLHIYDRSSAPTRRIKVKSIYLMLKFLWFFPSPLCAQLLVSICFCCWCDNFFVPCLVLAFCILHGLSISLIPAFSCSHFLSFLSSSTCFSLLFVQSVPEFCSLFCLPSEWTEPAWHPCILSACLSHSTVPAS